MDEAKLIDWYEVVEAVANGRLTGHACPLCGARPLEAAKDGARVRVRCPRCGEGFEGALGYGRDDGLYAEADAMMRRQAAGGAASAAPTPSVVESQPATSSDPNSTPPTTTATSTRVATRPAPPPEPWEWTLPTAGAGDPEALAVWIDLVEAVINGRRSGLRCPFCSEPLDDVYYEDPHVRLCCRTCGEAFEGRVR